VAEQRSAALLRALAHPLRLSALVALEQRERPAAELAAVLVVAPDALAEHLADLAAAGLVTGGADGGPLRTVERGWIEIDARLRQVQDGAA
jgi:DNA-binding transcriptional ArsR family regulator